MTSRPGVHAGHLGEYRTCTHVDCTTHRDRYRKRWAYERSHGLKRLVDATPVRLHIASLIGAGWSYRAIAGASDVSPTTVHRVGRGLQATLQRAVAARILDVTGLPSRPTKGADEPFVPKVGTVRRIQALLYMGHRHEDIDPRSGVILNQQGRWVVRSTHDRIAAAFDRLAMQPGPSERTRRRARALGYLGPLDWDDIDLDAQPVRAAEEEREVDEVAVQRRLAGERLELTVAERRMLVGELWSQGLGAGTIATRCGFSADVISKDIERLGLRRAAS